MKRFFTGIVLISLMMPTLSGCGSDNVSETSDSAVKQVEVEQDTQEVSTDTVTSKLTLSIDGEALDISWEDNDSVSALTELAGEKPLEIHMSMYGDFEQVGSIGANLPANDVQTVTEPGDIVLYQGNQFVIFYGSNSWSYTRLGHVEGKTDKELATLLGEQDVILTLEMK